MLFWIHKRKVFGKTLILHYWTEFTGYPLSIWDEAIKLLCWSVLATILSLSITFLEDFDQIFHVNHRNFPVLQAKAETENSPGQSKYESCT